MNNTNKSEQPEASKPEQGDGKKPFPCEMQIEEGVKCESQCDKCKVLFAPSETSELKEGEEKTRISFDEFHENVTGQYQPATINKEKREAGEETLQKKLHDLGYKYNSMLRYVVYGSTIQEIAKEFYNYGLFANQAKIAEQAQEIERVKLNLAREQRFRKEDGMSAAQEQGRLWQEIQTLKAEVERWKQNFLET